MKLVFKFRILHPKRDFAPIPPCIGTFFYLKHERREVSQQGAEAVCHLTETTSKAKCPNKPTSFLFTPIVGATSEAKCPDKPQSCVFTLIFKTISEVKGPDKPKRGGEGSRWGTGVGKGEDVREVEGTGGEAREEKVRGSKCGCHKTTT